MELVRKVSRPVTMVESLVAVGAEVVLAAHAAAAAAAAVNLMILAI